jgi:hypothetical protein
LLEFRVPWVCPGPEGWRAARFWVKESGTSIRNTVGNGNGPLGGRAVLHTG